MLLTQTASPHTGKRIYVDEEGNKYPSVSRLAKEFFSTYGLYLWKKKLGKEEADRIRDEAAIRGTAIHACIETGTNSDNPEYHDYVEQYRKHIAPYLVILQAELILGYTDPNKRRFAGTADLIGLWHDELIIGDWKTSEELKNPKYFGSFALQLAAYALAFEQEYGQVINKGVIFNLTPNKAVPFEIYLEHPKLFLLQTVLPAFYRFYSLPQYERGYANNFISKEISQFERELVVA